MCIILCNGTVLRDNYIYYICSLSVRTMFNVSHLIIGMQIYIRWKEAGSYKCSHFTIITLIIKYNSVD